MTTQFTVRLDFGASLALPPLWRHKTDMELGGVREAAITLNGAPQVFTLLERSVKLTKDWQFFIRAINYNMDIRRVSAIFGYRRAFTNSTGFGDPDNPRADYLLNENLGYGDPLFDKVRTCARAVMTGTINGDFSNHLNIVTMDGNNPPPMKPGKPRPQRVADIQLDDYLYSPQTHPWLFFVANNVRPGGSTVPFSDDGGVYEWTGDPRPYTFLPHVSRYPVTYPLSNLVPLPASSLVPNPYQIL